MLLQLKSPYLVPEMTTEDMGDPKHRLRLVDRDFCAYTFCYLFGLF